MLALLEPQAVCYVHKKQIVSQEEYTHLGLRSSIPFPLYDPL